MFYNLEKQTKFSKPTSKTWGILILIHYKVSSEMYLWLHLWWQERYCTEHSQFSGIVWLIIKYITLVKMRTNKWLQHSKFTSAVSKCWGFCWGIYMFFSVCLSKKNTEAIKFFGILKNTSLRINYIFVKKKRKEMFRLIKKLFLFFT